MSRRKGGVYVPLDVNFFDDPRIVRAGEKSALLYLAMCAACKRLAQDGTLEPLQVDRLHISGWRKRMDALLREGLVLDLSDGNYTIASWFQHNDSVAEISRRRAEDAARKRGARPVGLRLDSDRTPNVREGKGREKEGSTPHGPCPGCSEPDCSSPSLRVVGERS